MPECVLTIRVIKPWWLRAALWGFGAWAWARAFVGRPVSDERVTQLADQWAKRFLRHCRVVVSA